MTLAKAWPQALDAAERSARAGIASLDLVELERDRELEDDATLATVASVLRALGAFRGPFAQLRLEGLASALGVVPQYDKLLRRWVLDLAEAGILARNGDTFSAGQLHQPSNGPKRPHLDEITTILVDALTGKHHILEYVFGDLRPEWFESYTESSYRSPPLFAYLHAIVREMVSVFVGGATDREPLRVLEIGAGMGGLTTSIVPLLPPGKATYFFTDVSPDFVRTAKKTFREKRELMRYRHLDINEDPTRSGLERGRFDLVLAFDVLHCARDLAQTLRWLRSLMKPGGVLVNEQLTANRLSYLVIPGVMPGYTDFEDDRLQDYRTLPTPAAWCEKLVAAGFEAPQLFPRDAQLLETLGQGVIVARNPE